MGCPASLAALQNIEANIAKVLEELQKSNTSLLADIVGAERYKEDMIRFSVANVGDTMVSTQLTDMITGTNYIVKDLEVYFSGTPTADATLDLSTSSVAGAGAQIAGRWYQTGSFIHLDGNSNGHLGNALSTKPYLHLCAGTGSIAQTVYCTLRYYYK